MSSVRRWIVGLAGLLISLLVCAHPTAARVIGILFDDSGSMSSRIHLPTFGAQLLVSTLDGRAGRDQLFTVRLSQALAALGSNGRMTNLPPGGVTADNVAAWAARAPAALTTESISTPQQQQQTLDKIRQRGRLRGSIRLMSHSRSS